jgi:hypothetical protein
MKFPPKRLQRLTRVSLKACMIVAASFVFVGCNSTDSLFRYRTASGRSFAKPGEPFGIIELRDKSLRLQSIDGERIQNILAVIDPDEHPGPLFRVRPGEHLLFINYWNLPYGVNYSGSSVAHSAKNIPLNIDVREGMHYRLSSSFGDTNYRFYSRVSVRILETFPIPEYQTSKSARD